MATEQELSRARWADAVVRDPHFRELEDVFNSQAFSVLLNAPIGEEGDAERRKAALMANAMVDVRNWLETWATYAP